MGKSKDLATLKDSGLSISGASGDILNVSSATGSEFAMRVDGNEISFKADADNDDNDSVMTFDLDGSEKMRLTDTGKLGLGTTNPVHDLQIHKATASSQARIQMTTNESGATNSDGYAVAMESGNRVYHWLYENVPMQFATNNTLNMVINANGSVTKPNQPSACWGTSVDRTLPQNSSWVDVQLDAENYDRGNNYNNSNYRFTAPVAGVYLVGFSGEFNCTSATTWTYLCPRINGSNTANLNSKGNYFADFITPVASYYQHSQTWLLNLAENDYFTFSANGSGGTLKVKSNAECQFFATLLG